MANLRVNNLYGISGPDTNGSALFNGTDYLTAANAAAFRLNQSSTENFTMEAWIYVTGDTFMRIGRIYETSGNQRSYDLYLSSDLEIKFNYSSNGTAGGVSTLTGNTVPKNEWVHVAIAHEVSTTTLRLFLNGLNVATDNAPHTTYYANTTSDFTLGEAFIGNISNFHITKSCKYTGDFDPYKEPIEEDSNTTVLCLNSRLDVLNDDKSNTFTQTATGGVKASTLMPFSRTDDGLNFNGPISLNTQGYMYFPTGTTEQRGRGRALIAGGSTPSVTTAINFLNIQSSGRSIDFGDLTHGRYDMSGCSSSTRGVFAGGRDPAGNEIDDTIDFVTIATTANATDFGNLTAERGGTQGAVSNGTRGIWGGGFEPSQVNKIEFVTIATTANATDFGDLTAARSGCGRAMSTTRGLFASGGTPSAVNTIDYITMATAGNATDFGDTTDSGANGLQGTSSNTRGIFAGMGPSRKTINFVTIATTGNGTDFGDMRFDSSQRTGTGNKIRGIFMGGYISPTGRTTLIDQITIATTGDATAFGDLITTTSFAGSTSDSHGGL